MVACPFILPGHLLLGVVGFCDMTALLPRHERGERWDSRAVPPSTLVQLLPPSIFTGPNLSIFRTKACPQKEELVLGLVSGSRVILHAASFECLAAGLPSFNPSHANYSPPFSTCMPNHNSSNHACLGWNIELAPPLKIWWCYPCMQINAMARAFSWWRDHTRLAREN